MSPREPPVEIICGEHRVGLANAAFFRCGCRHFPPAPPLGVLPAFLWSERHPEPDAGDVLARIDDLDAATRRYIEARREPPVEWLFERLLLEVRRRLDVARGAEGLKYWRPAEAAAVAGELEELLASVALIERGGQR